MSAHGQRKPLSLEARMRFEDAALGLARVLDRVANGTFKALRLALAPAMRKLNLPGRRLLVGFHEKLIFLAVIGEAICWARILHTPAVVLELERLRDTQVDPSDPAGRALAALEADLAEGRETSITWTKEADAMR